MNDYIHMCPDCERRHHGSIPCGLVQLSHMQQHLPEYHQILDATYYNAYYRKKAAEMKRRETARKKIDWIAVGMRIRILREEAGWSQLKLAHRLNFSQPITISCWERGQRIPYKSDLNNLAKLFGVSVDYLKYGAKIHENTDE